MNILHYALGFPPYRTGGLTKFCIDLMNQQITEGHSVSLLWPGKFSLFHRNTYIKSHGKNGLIGNYEVINPTPVSYDEGITEIEAFMKNGDEKEYECFLRELNPEVIHIHTLMGLHKALLIAANRLNIRIVFSTHDFFPICPKVTMFRNGMICDGIQKCENCAECNTTALSLPKIYLLQSALYRKLKDSFFVKKLRKQHRDHYLSGSAEEKNGTVRTKRTAEDYQILRNHFKGLIEMADVIHYNSSVTQNVYEKYLPLSLPKAVCIPITHADVQDHKRVKHFGKKLRITYLGPESGAKGFFLLRSALDRLWYDPQNGRKDFCLNIYFLPADISPYMKVHGRYSYDQLEEIFENTDILVAPSVWHETFGYTVLEALSYGVPVVLSDTVGAKDIVPVGTGIIINEITAEKLAQVILKLNPIELQHMNQAVVQDVRIPDLSVMSHQISNQCYQ